MNNYIQQVTESLKRIISELSENPALFLRNPKTDFSRRRKIDFKTFVGITMNSGGCTMSKELLDYFNFSVNTPTVSAYVQQRSKVLPEAFEFLFHSFTEENLPSARNYDGYRLIACDGSNLTIATNPDDTETAGKCNQYNEVSNHLHLNAFYDVLNRVYLDAIVQTAAEHRESLACIRMMDRSILERVILVADRGYENYNIMAHAINKGWKFLIRIKDVTSNGIAASLALPQTDCFDKDVFITFTRKQTKAARASGLKHLPSNVTFDYLPVRSDGTYSMSFRIARFSVGDGSFETIVTNLERSYFPTEKLKDIYHMRWGVETSFRELKYAIGLTSFHARKVDFIKQEIFARMLLYNYCEMITAFVVQQNITDHKTKQVNFTAAIYICREYLRQKRQLSPPIVIKLIAKYILPVRPDRKDRRKVKFQACVSFLYRVA